MALFFVGLYILYRFELGIALVVGEFEFLKLNRDANVDKFHVETFGPIFLSFALL